MTAEATLPRPIAWKQAWTTLLFSAALFLSAASMFMLQPMTGKMLLPLVGGAPSGWIVAMAFFQVMLLAGYAAARFLSRLSPRAHGLCFIGVLALGCLSLPLHMHAAEGEPGPFMVLRLLAATSALPCVALSMASSTLQRIFASAGHRASGDPYFLYAASNLGSFAGLLFYPFYAERWLAIPEQTHLWLYAYGALMALACACLAFADDAAPAKQVAAPVPRKLRLQWIAYAALPSSLMLGVTMQITTTVLAAPLVWVVPLGLYLLTFVIAFGRKQFIPLSWLERAQPLLVSVSLAIICITTPKFIASWITMGWHLVAFTSVALLCHMRLAALRPVGDGQKLTDYYFMIALGGAIGGAFNAFIAPLVFNRLAEYALVLVASCFFHPAMRTRYPARHLAYPVTAALGILALTGARKYLDIGFNDMRDISLIVLFTLATLHPRAVVTGSVVLGLIAAFASYPFKNYYYARNFFGTMKTYDHKGKIDGELVNVRTLVHGSTIHGRQVLGGPLETEMVSYYSRRGPAGDLFGIFSPKNIAVMGLGTGTLACYATPQRRFTFLEIDPEMVKIAKTRFTYLEKCQSAAPHRIILGDGRLEMAKLEEKFDLIILDAFSSDMVPAHLLSVEAIENYKKHLTQDGVIAFHISNRYIRLWGTLAAAAEATGLQALQKYYDDDDALNASSQWLVMARPGTSLVPLQNIGWFKPLSDGAQPWTDTYSSPLGVLRL